MYYEIRLVAVMVTKVAATARVEILPQANWAEILPWEKSTKAAPVGYIDRVPSDSFRDHYQCLAVTKHRSVIVQQCTKKYYCSSTHCYCASTAMNMDALVKQYTWMLYYSGTHVLIKNCTRMHEYSRSHKYTLPAAHMEVLLLQKCTQMC